MKQTRSDSPQLKKTLFIILLIFIINIFISGLITHSQAAKKQIHVIPIDGDIDPAMSAFVKRAISDLPDEKETIVIFEMDTNGGRVDSALEIVDAVSGMRQAKTIAYIKNKALSAGALISLACKSIVMRNNTTIGDCAPITYTGEGIQVQGEKIQAPLRAKFRALAKLNGYPAVLAESMVTMEMIVYEVILDNEKIYMDSVEYEELSTDVKKRIKSKKTVVKEGELLTMDNAEAKALGFSLYSVSGIDDMLSRMNIKEYELARQEKNWSEILVRFLLLITPILLLIGLGAIYTEIKSPGFGIPGIIGIIFLGLAFGSQYIVGLADYTELLIIGVGVILLALEVLVIPGFGIAGILGFLFIAAGMILALQNFTLPDPSAPWEKELLVTNVVKVLGSLFASFFVMFFFIRFIGTRFSAAGGPFLNTSLKASRADSMETRKASVNDEGIAVTYLRPSGKMMAGDNLFDVTAEGEFIEKDTPVIVKKIQGNRIIVAKKDA